MTEVLNELTEEQIEFICNECSITEDELFAMDDDELYSGVYDVMCDIEIAEIPSSDDEDESERCRLASEIVTELGNALAKAEGIYDEDEE